MIMTRQRIIKGIGFFSNVAIPDDKYDSAQVRRYLPAFIKLLEDHFGLRGTQLKMTEDKNAEYMKRLVDETT